MSAGHGGHEVDPKELWKFHKYLYELHTFASQVEGVARSEGANTEGFTGLLAPLQGSCTILADDIVAPAFAKLKSNLANLADAVNRSAVSYGLTDEMVAEGWDEMYNKVGPS